jgi:hypothetical protein
MGVDSRPGGQKMKTLCAQHTEGPFFLFALDSSLQSCGLARREVRVAAWRMLPTKW